ncbi:MAG: transposase [Candidatus Aminicenantes bacterium]|nr:transposase [Candidatus Aminicenantes bacterium]
MERWRKHWRRLHIGVDENGRILASKVTDGHEHDPSQVPNFLAQVEREIDRFVGDRIYDKKAVYEAVDHHSSGAEVGRAAEKKRGVVQQSHQFSLSSRPSYCGDPEQGMVRVETSVWILFAESRGKRILSLQENHWGMAES